MNIKQQQQGTDDNGPGMTTIRWSESDGQGSNITTGDDEVICRIVSNSSQHTITKFNASTGEWTEEIVQGDLNVNFGKNSRGCIAEQINTGGSVTNYF